MPKVSVIMPCYNVAQYVGEAIESILNQTFSDFEFIIINDGSTDDTAQIIRRYAAQDKRIKFIDNTQNQGFIAVSNQCLDVAMGDYIAKMDSDDISVPERLETQVAFLDANPNIGMVGAAYKTFGAFERTIVNPKTIKLFDLLSGCKTTIVMFRRNIIEKHHLRYDSKFVACEDYDFYTRFIKYADIANLPDVLYLYRIHGNNASIINNDIQTQNTNIIRRRILDMICSDQRTAVHLMSMTSETTRKFYLFGIIPIVRRKQYALTKTRYYLFNKIPLFKVQNGKIYLFEFIKIGDLR